MESQPLSKEEAQDEAGMLQAHLELTGVNEATAEDYDAALEAIGELKQLAGSEEAMKAADILARLAERSRFAFELVSMSLSHAPFAASVGVGMVVGDHEKAMYELGTAEQKLRKLKEKSGIQE